MAILIGIATMQRDNICIDDFISNFKKIQPFYQKLFVVDNKSGDRYKNKIKEICRINWYDYLDLGEVIIPDEYKEIPKELGFSPYLVQVRNKIREEAIKRGCDYLVFLDSDNFPPPNWIETLQPFFKKHDDVGIIGGLCSRRGTNIKINGNDAVCINFFMKEKDKADWILKNIMKFEHVIVDGISLSGAIIKRECFENVRFEMSKKYGEDINFCLKAREKGWKTLITPSVYIKHYHPDGKIV